MSSVEIVSEMKSLNEILLNSYNSFSIPDFQRNFVWGKKDVKALLDDFSEDTDGFTKDSSELEGYLLGNIVLIAKQNDNEKIVVDGQQRLTTLSLLFKALDVIGAKKIQKYSNDLPTMTKWMDRISGLKKGYMILDDQDNFKSLRIVHSPSLNFGSYYNKLIHDSLDDIEPTASSDINIQIVYDEISDFISTLDDDQLTKLIIYLKTKVKIIVTSAPTEAKAFQLFEVLNDRGRSLEPMDLIKNNFLKRLNYEGKPENQIDEFNNNWKKYGENLVINKKKQISSSTFMRHYLMAFEGINKKQDQLFEYFKENEKNYLGDKILELGKNLSKYSKIYASIEKKNYSSFLDDNNMFLLFEILGVKQMQPLLMLFYFSDNDKKREVLDLSTRFAASVIFSYTQTNYIENKVTYLTSRYHSIKDKDVAYACLINEMELLISERAKIVKSVIESRDFTSQSGKVQNKALDLLKFVESYFNQNPLIKTPHSGKKITIEHILSRKIDLDDSNDAGFSNLSEKKDYENRIGNLTLLYNTDNSSIGNKKFEGKMQIYKDSDFKMTHCIVEPLSTSIKSGIDTKLYSKINKIEKSYKPNLKGHFDKELIEQRSKDFAEALYKILTNEFDD